MTAVPYWHFIRAQADGISCEFIVPPWAFRCWGTTGMATKQRRILSPGFGFTPGNSGFGASQRPGVFFAFLALLCLLSFGRTYEGVAWQSRACLEASAGC
jgi:hypothetical protein